FIRYLGRGKGVVRWLVSIGSISMSTCVVLTVLGPLYYDYLAHYVFVLDGKPLFTLTGRTLIWQELIQGAYMNFFGNGLSAFDLRGPQPFPNIIYSAHNELLNQIFAFGLFGGIFIISCY